MDTHTEFTLFMWVVFHSSFSLDSILVIFLNIFFLRDINSIRVHWTDLSFLITVYDYYWNTIIPPISFLECCACAYTHTHTHTQTAFFSCNDRKPSSVLIRDIAVGPGPTPPLGEQYSAEGTILRSGLYSSLPFRRFDLLALARQVNFSEPRFPL